MTDLILSNFVYQYIILWLMPNTLLFLQLCVVLTLCIKHTMLVIKFNFYKLEDMIILASLTVEANKSIACVNNDWRKSLGGTHEYMEIGHFDHLLISFEGGRLRESLVASNAIFHELYETVSRDVSVTYNRRQRGNHEAVQKSPLGEEGTGACDAFSCLANCRLLKTVLRTIPKTMSRTRERENDQSVYRTPGLFETS